MVRKSSSSLLSLIPLLAAMAGCQKYTARPLQVDVVALQGPAPGSSRLAVQGAFQLAIAEPHEGYALGYYLSGGGCLIAQDEQAPKHCSTDDNCAVDWTDSKGVRHNGSTGAYGYCLGAFEGGKTCWTKLSNHYCRKQVYSANKQYTPAVTEAQMREFLGVPDSKKLGWRVITCVNGADDKAKDVGVDAMRPPCGEKNPLPFERFETVGWVYSGP